MAGATNLTAKERSLRGTAAVYTSWANTTDPSARTKPAREAFAAKFEKQVDPEGVLPPEERARRAEAARKAHFARLSFLAVKARRAKAGLG